MTRGTGPPSAGDDGADIGSPALGIVRRNERPAHGGAPRSGADPDPAAVPPHLDVAARAWGELETDLLILVNEHAAVGDHDRRDPVLPPPAAEAGSFSVAELEVGRPVPDIFGGKPRLLGRIEARGRLPAPGQERETAQNA
jgi:hypothetical protein